MSTTHYDIQLLQDHEEFNSLKYKQLKAHHSLVFLLDDNLLPVLTFWLEHFNDWLKGLIKM